MHHRTRRVATGFAALVLTVAGTGLTSVAAHAAPASPTMCEPNMQSIKMTSTSSTRTVTHAKYFSIPAGGGGEVSRTVEKVGSITASVSYSSTTEVSAKAIIGELSESVGVTVAASGTKTKSTSETVKVTVSSGKYAFFSGVKKFKGKWTSSKCNSSGTKVIKSNGSAVSFAVPADGAAKCSSSYATSSFEYKAKVIAC
ncbi:hypothetical protein [Actinoplanes sp. TFC3]|uniref:hypothetical protein n=1 Tax=Actinoplanes sp. TFC3 TaxID=1710355 RepID=UPI0008338E59|nr:hypothetical protein [Actinoplanes sp. TFC3]